MRGRLGTWVLAALLALAIVRLWLVPLPSSFWTDEANTVFLIHYGPSHPSLAASPQLPESIYYLLPRIAERLAGFSEVVYRLPSTLALAAALGLIAALAARLIHPQAAWFAVFGCLALQGFNFQAAEARPYALGTAIMAAALWFLVRWLDRARWRDAALFVVFAALLWRVQPVYWPFYAVFVAYAAARLAWRETAVTWRRAAGVFAALALALLPVLLQTLALLGNARAHVITPLPDARDLAYAIKPGLLLECGLGAWLLSRLCRWSPDRLPIARSTFVLILAWWLWGPLCLFAFSRLSGISLFVNRYYSLALPGAALAAAILATRSIPARLWKPMAATLGLGVVLLLGDWRQAWPPHTKVDWRDAAHAIDALTLGPSTPIVCPSPFIEAAAPVWRPDYSLPSVLYSQLAVYPVRGRIYPFPFRDSPEADRLAATLSQTALRASGRFFVYGRGDNARFWAQRFERSPSLAGWTSRGLGPFGDVTVVEFEAP